MQACPLTVIRRDGAIPARIVPVRPNFNTYGHGHLETMETLSDVLLRLGAVSEYPNTEAAYVVDIRPVNNVYCGGRVVWQLLLSKSDMGRFDEWQTRTVYISDDDGQLSLAIPA